MAQRVMPGFDTPVSTEQAQEIVNEQVKDAFGQVNHSIRYRIVLRADDLVEDEFYYTAQGFFGHFTQAYNFAHREMAEKNVSHNAPILRIWRIVSIKEVEKDA